MSAPEQRTPPFVACAPQGKLPHSVRFARGDQAPEARGSSPRTKFARALRLRCPRCGSPGLLEHWLKTKERCPTCGLALQRGEDHDFWLGAFAINLVIAEGLAAIIGIIVLRRTWPEYTMALAVATVLAIVMPLLFFPWSRMIWLAWDLSFRPVEEGDDAG
jgi:uncharacterized protein (DUF983 family)